MRTNSTYYPELAQTPFYLGRHGESFGNTGILSQGRGEDKPDKLNGLTPKGVLQVEAAVLAIKAAGINVQYVSSSTLSRAKESATTFVNASLDPKPTLAGEVAPGHEHGIKEVSQEGWEGIYDREQRNRLRKEKLARFMGDLALTNRLDQEDILNYAAWIMRLGDERGESPLTSALRGIIALEEHGVKPGELVFSHAMLNRYMDAIATAMDSEDRQELHHLLEDQSIPESTRNVTVIRRLKELGIKDFKIHDSAANRQANGGVAGYTVNPASGRWVAGRRIEPSDLESEHAYIEHRRNAGTGQWERTRPGSHNGDNE
jgi:broad specificity phosphatase PhoE